jgi:predicted metal-dependent HD superfamily phosphohydrolase
MSTNVSIAQLFNWKEAFAGVVTEAIGAATQQEYLRILSSEIAAEAFAILGKVDESTYRFHNRAHTASVLWGLLLLMQHEQLDGNNRKQLILAALYHDTGYIEGPNDHEQRSVEIVRQHAPSTFDEQEISSVCEIILSTKLHVHPDPITYSRYPRGLLSEYLLDADLINVGFEFSHYCRICLKLLCEQQKRALSDFTEDELLKFQINNVEFLRQFHFQTKAGVSLFGKSRDEKIHRLAEACENGRQIMRVAK